MANIELMVAMRSRQPVDAADWDCAGSVSLPVRLIGGNSP